MEIHYNKILTSQITVHRDSAKFVCALNADWFQKLRSSIISGDFPGKIPSSFNPQDFLMIPEKTWTELSQHFGSEGRADVFIVEGKPDLSFIEILVSFNEEDLKLHRVSGGITVKTLKEYICELEDIDSSKYKLRIIEEIQGGTIAFKQISEDLTVNGAGIKSGTKVSLSKASRRVVKFVESDEEDKVVEISIKQKKSTVPSTSCYSDSRDLSEVEDSKKDQKRLKLRIKSIKKIQKNLKRIIMRYLES